MRYKEVIIGFIILILYIVGSIGIDLIPNDKTIIINQNNNSKSPTFYDISIDTDLGPIEQNFTRIYSDNDIYGVTVIQNITFFKGFNDEVIMRNYSLSGYSKYQIYDKYTGKLRYFINPKDILEESHLNETGDILIKTVGTSYFEKSFSIKIDLNTLRNMAADKDFNNSFLKVSYHPQLSLDVHIIDKNAKRTLTLNPTYYFYIDLDEVFD